jgi:hypothetical protein
MLGFNDQGMMIAFFTALQALGYSNGPPQNQDKVLTTSTKLLSR